MNGPTIEVIHTWFPPPVQDPLCFCLFKSSVIWLLEKQSAPGNWTKPALSLRQRSDLRFLHSAWKELWNRIQWSCNKEEVAKFTIHVGQINPSSLIIISHDWDSWESEAWNASIGYRLTSRTFGNADRWSQDYNCEILAHDPIFAHPFWIAAIEVDKRINKTNDHMYCTAACECHRSSHQKCIPARGSIGLYMNWKIWRKYDLTASKSDHE